MARQPIIALVFPYRHIGDTYEFAIFNPADCEDDFWQSISGGAEDQETPVEAARREMWEEARIDPETPLTALDSTETIPAANRKNSGWGDDVYVIRKYFFGADIGNQNIVLSEEHTEYRWCTFDEADGLLKLQNDRYALGELWQRIQRVDL